MQRRSGLAVAAIAVASVFIFEMKPSAGARALMVADDRGRRWRVDLATHAAAAGTSP